FARAAVTAGVQIATFISGEGLQAPHVSVTAGIGTARSYWCSVVNSDDDKLIVATVQQGLSITFPSDDWEGTFAAGSDLRLTVALVGSNNQCSVVEGMTSGGVSGNTGVVSGAVQVATQRTAASFDYLFVVSIGN